MKLPLFFFFQALYAFLAFMLSSFVAPGFGGGGGGKAHSGKGCAFFFCFFESLAYRYSKRFRSFNFTTLVSFGCLLYFLANALYSATSFGVAL